MSDSDRLSVVVEAGASPATMQALAELFDTRGIEAEVRDDYVRLSAGQLGWILDFIAHLEWLALAFGSGFAAKAGADAWDEFRAGGWRGLATFIKQVYSARGSDGAITVRDPDGPDVHLDDRIPEDALAELGEFDWGAMSDGMLIWSSEKGEWRFIQARRAPRGVKPPRRGA
jgi:hypothetical protein